MFAVYVADAVGYSGAISVLLGKDLLAGDTARIDFFRSLTYVMSVVGVVLLILAFCLPDEATHSLPGPRGSYRQNPTELA
ncbi:MAG: hypothetical protein CM1200mP2_23800 [Planctomycetaceae bacterium]|nr:MAG: hypothetical protein CM1200mP2_23800 [Planctomycetaceae bacterium]